MGVISSTKQTIAACANNCLIKYLTGIARQNVPAAIVKNRESSRDDIDLGVCGRTVAQNDRVIGKDRRLLKRDTAACAGCRVAGNRGVDQFDIAGPRHVKEVAVVGLNPTTGAIPIRDNVVRNRHIGQSCVALVEATSKEELPARGKKTAPLIFGDVVGDGGVFSNQFTTIANTRAIVGAVEGHVGIDQLDLAIIQKAATIAGVCGSLVS